MRIDYTLRPNVMKTNARYRGPSESNKYNNFIGEVVHDMNLLGRVLDRDDLRDLKGQTDYIDENLSVYFSGDNGEMYTTVPTATTLFKIESPVMDKVQFLTDAKWVEYGNCTATNTTLQGSITDDTSGTQYSLPVQEGQVIYIKAKVALVSGDVPAFQIGSANVNNGEGSLSRFKVTSTPTFIGHYIFCRHKETITLNFDVSRGDGAATNGKVTLSDISISYAEVKDLSLQPLNTVLKSNVNELEKEIRNIINNL